MPLPAGLYYWNPNNSRELTIGTYGSSQTLTGQVKPIDYGRFIDVTPLKLTGINYNNKTSYIINDYIANEIGVKNPITAIGENVFPNKEMTTLQLPAGVTTVEGTTFPHSVTQAFISHGNWHFSGNLLYLKTSDISRLMTVVGNNTELSIDCRYCNSILDEALKGQSRLKNLYVNTWFPVDATEYKPVELLGNNVFSGCPNDLNVYIKDGTCINDFGTSGDDDEGNLVQEIIGRDIDHGYKYHENMWSRRFYSESADDDNHLFQYYPVTRNPARLSTIVLGFATSLPSDCRAWVATGVDTEKGELVLKRVQGNILPARLPVLLSYEQTSGIIHLRPYEGTDAPPATMYERSIFRGSIIPKGQKMDASEMQTNFYTLSRLKGSTDWNTVAFRPFHPADGILPSYTAWIPESLIPDNIAYSADAKFALVFDGDYDLSDTNGITDVADKADAPSAPAYNLSGQRVGSNYRGMIIKNGRKYIAK
ncbi:MAG: hypothetical protein J5953_16330 [Prevotella sp.]|nr:hypothetical protein [Prevotella sp.]